MLTFRSPGTDYFCFSSIRKFSCKVNIVPDKERDELLKKVWAGGGLYLQMPIGIHALVEYVNNLNVFCSFAVKNHM